MEFIRSHIERLRPPYTKKQRRETDSPPEAHIHEKQVPESRELTDPRIKKIQLTETTLDALQQRDHNPLAEQIKNTITKAGLSEDELVFRCMMHPQGNATIQLVSMYGTDRFVGYDSTNIPPPEAIDEVIPYRNTGETRALTADTYCVPDLNWALAFTKLDSARDQADFVYGETEAFLLAYKHSAVETHRTPPGGGEQWRTTFLTDPNEALALIIHIQPPDNSLH